MEHAAAFRIGTFVNDAPRFQFFRLPFRNIQRFRIFQNGHILFHSISPFQFGAQRAPLDLQRLVTLDHMARATRGFPRAHGAR